ncbi:MAG: hypothetical protein ACJAVR_001767 [Paracoccaceae bacterium]|jgi:hypothetical protein
MMTEVLRHEKTRAVRQRLRWRLVATLMSLSACTSITNSEPKLNVQRQLLTFRTVPDFVAANAGEIGATIEALNRFAARIPLRGREIRKAMPAQVALLHGSPDGRAYLSVPDPRAFVIGAPPAICPARVTAAGGKDQSDATGAALRGCFDALAAAKAPDDCGCRVMAAGAALLAPLPDFAYAPGVSGWVVAPTLDLDLHLAVREGTSPEGDRKLTFLTGPGADIRALLRRDGTATMTVRRRGLPDLALAGIHRPEGLRRGRFADRLRLTDADGHETVALIGYEPVEYAIRRKELLGWR